MNATDFLSAPRTPRPDLKERLQAGIAAARKNHRQEAREMLLGVVEEDEANEQAWLWLSTVVDSDEERQICLQNVLAVNPEHTAARRGLAIVEKRLGLPSATQDDVELADSSTTAEVLPADLVAGPDDRAPEATTVPGFTPTPRFNDVWNQDVDLCAYCAHELEPDAYRCPDCGRSLSRWHFRYPESNSNLHLFWVLLVGVGQLFLLNVLIDYFQRVEPTRIILHAAVTVSMFVLAAGIYFRLFWAHVASIIALLAILFLRLLGYLGMPVPLFPHPADPTVSLIVSPFILVLEDIVVILQVAVIVIALFWALFQVGPEFERIRYRMIAHVDRGLVEPATFFAVGREYANKGMWATAVRHWQRAVALAPSNPRYQMRLGEAYARLGFYTRSLDILQTAQRLPLPTEERAEIDRMIEEIRSRPQ